MKFSEKEIIIGSILGVIILALLINYFWANPLVTKFCGDGICSKNEIGNCKLDCDWCGDGYCQEGESCSNCPQDCNSCSATSFCGDGTCNKGECDSGCWKDCTYAQCENGVCEVEKGENCINSPNDCTCKNGYCDKNTKQCIYQSCGDDICESYENYLNCPNDCKNAYTEQDTSDINYPIILLHGHSLSDEESGSQINSFKEFQEKMDSDGYAVNKGIVLPRKMDIVAGSWGKLDKPVVVRSTYYLNAYDEFGSVVGVEDNQHIDIYAQRLSQVVDNLLSYTGKKKVVIIAHSMGGLVARDYIRNYDGKNKVEKLINIGTPNHGIYGDIATKCENWFLGSFFGVGRAETSPECNDMRNDNNFITNLNSGGETFPGIAYLTIRGKANQGLVTHVIPAYSVCPSSGEYGDEVVCETSVPLTGATNREVVKSEVQGTGTLHSDLIHPSKVPEVYQYVTDFLKN